MADWMSEKGTELSGSGLEVRCARCGTELPLLHPHIMVERYDEDENVICDECYLKHCGNPSQSLSPS